MKKSLITLVLFSLLVNQNYEHAFATPEKYTYSEAQPLLSQSPQNNPKKPTGVEMPDLCKIGGFIEGTVQYANCNLELYLGPRKFDNHKYHLGPVVFEPIGDEDVPARCKSFGFKEGTIPYANCKMEFYFNSKKADINKDFLDTTPSDAFKEASDRCLNFGFKAKTFEYYTCYVRQQSTDTLDEAAKWVNQNTEESDSE